MRTLNFRTLLVVGVVTAFSTPVIAEGLRVPVGDLHDPAAAARFDRQLTAASRRLCAGLVRPQDLERQAACVAASRHEGLEQLGEDQRQALVRALGPSTRLASSAR